MALIIKCNCCRKELDEPGAILISPPKDPESSIMETLKFHICVKCYEFITMNLVNLD